MEEPTYDLIANPISSFTTFGEAAPSPEATVEGMPAPPIDEYGPLLAQLTQLSNTITGIVMDNRKLQSEGDLIQGQIAGEQISPEDLNNLVLRQRPDKYFEIVLFSRDAQEFPLALIANRNPARAKLQELYQEHFQNWNCELIDESLN